MQGLFVDGNRPSSKKQVRDVLALGQPERISIEATSFFGNEYDGELVDAPVGTKVDFVGPDPYRSRKFYGRLSVTEKGVKLS